MPRKPVVRETVSLYQAKTQLSRLVDRAAEGEEIVISKSGRPRARLVPLVALFAAFSFVIMMFNVPLPGGTTGHAVGGALAASMFLLLIALLHFWVLGRPLSASIGAPLTTLILFFGAIIGAWLGLRYEARKRKLR